MILQVIGVAKKDAAAAAGSNRSKPNKRWWWRQTTGSTGSLTALAYRTPCACSVDPEGERGIMIAEHASCVLLLAAGF